MATFGVASGPSSRTTCGIRTCGTSGTYENHASWPDHSDSTGVLDVLCWMLVDVLLLATSRSKSRPSFEARVGWTVCGLTNRLVCVQIDTLGG